MDSRVNTYRKLNKVIFVKSYKKLDVPFWASAYQLIVDEVYENFNGKWCRPMCLAPHLKHHLHKEKKYSNYWID